MSRSPKVPPGAVIIRSYEELAAEVDAFFGDFYDELFIVGDPGVGKSEHFRHRARHTAASSHYLEGNTKPLATYIECWQHRDKLLVLDDAEGLWASDNGKHLVRQLTQHSDNKYVQWLSTSKELERSGVPHHYYTTSKCAFLMNRFVASTNDHFYHAILDRGHVFFFDPLLIERHRYVATWFHDQEIHDYVGSHLNLVSDLTARTYNLLHQKKSAGHDWREYFHQRFCRPSGLSAVQELEHDDAFPTVEAKSQEFTRRGLGSRRTYFHHKAELAASGKLACNAVAPIKVQGTKPAQIDRKALLRRHADETVE